MVRFRFFLALLLLCAAAPVHAASTTDPRDNPALKADEAYRKSLEISRPKPNPLEQYEKAMEPIYLMEIQQATETLKKNPKDAEAYLKRANAHFAKKDYKSALPDYSKALELDPKLVKIYPKRAICNYLEKNYAEAEADVREADRNKLDVPEPFREALKKARKKK